MKFYLKQASHSRPIGDSVFNLESGGQLICCSFKLFLFYHLIIRFNFENNLIKFIKMAPVITQDDEDDLISQKLKKDMLKPKKTF